ncbi:glycoside hydrolase family 78 protein [Microbacterium sp. ISL-103]|uniref:glycoside hydrolase family 78 protein n=1 Tax=Microbacterium sp. ISL-103 TaxID=2819156 RepID=UPI0020363D2D|nr:glycoside hydrolase family 78 protein [Microbacterium sp. ISL-103]
MIGPDWEEDSSQVRRPGRVRTGFASTDDVASARLYITGMGVVEAEINGVRVGNEELTPGWTSYKHRLRYATFDVTGLIRPGGNGLGIWLGDGWWRGQLGFGSLNVNNYGERLGAQAQLEITDSRGNRTVVASDATWRAGGGPILSSGLYDGERYDARLHDSRWSGPSFDDSAWSAVRILPSPSGTLVAPTGPPVRVTQELPPVSINDRSDGRWIIDFGQNHSGKIRLRTKGGSGDVLTLRHSEILIDGEPAYEPLRDARATDELTCDGTDGFWSPRFTVHGYRYAEITGWSGPLLPEDVTSLVMHTDIARRGWFECSDDRLNALHDSAVWTLRSNIVDLPTDCPQRDERLGWTGDVQVFAPAATFLFDVTGVLDGWLRDVAAEQMPTGWIPLWVPFVDIPLLTEFFEPGPTAVWNDVAVLTPDALYDSSADLELIRRHYPTGKKHVDSVERAAGDSMICTATAQLGDWLDPAAPADDPAAALTEKELVATAYFAHSARRLAAMAQALGIDEDASRYSELSDRVKGAYGRRFILDDGHLTSDTQPAYALTTAFDLWPDAAHARIGGGRLAQLVRHADWTVGTGFAGTPVLAHALTAANHLDDAYRLLQNDANPSWLYMIANGATTTWERWDSLQPDGTLNTASMTSFNHLALGSVTDWMHRTIAGIAPAAPGYRRIRFAPRPGGTITSASARHHTPYGMAAISWELIGDALEVQVDVPVGAEAEVHLPDGGLHLVGHGHHVFNSSHRLASGGAPS